MHRTDAAYVHRRRTFRGLCVLGSVVNKDLTFKAKDLTFKAKAKDLTHKAEDLTLKAKAKDLTSEQVEGPLSG